MQLSNEKKALIRELRMNPVWGAMLDDINDMRRVARYRPSKGEQKQQTENWIYESGMDAAFEKVLRYLGYE